MLERTGALILMLVFSSPPLVAQSLASEKTGDTTTSLSRGQQISGAVATVTGVSVSPLVGVCVLGAWEHYRTPRPEREKLPLYTRPVFWIPIGVLLILILIKDTVGGFVPLVKKPLDAAEVLLVNKASLVLVAFPVLFHQVARLMGAQSLSDALALLAGSVRTVVYAAGPEGSALHTAGHVALGIVLLAVGSVTVVVVWMVGHAFDVLALVCPFPFLDLLLKGFRNAILVALAVTTAIDWKLGLAASLALILVCLALAGWAYRLLVFGVRFSWDLLRVLLTQWRRVPSPDKPILAFAARGMARIPRRTYGKLSRDSEGALVFQCRRFGVGPGRGLRLGNASEYEVGKGLLYPSLVSLNADRTKYRLMFRLLPRYVGSEGAVQACLGLAGVRDIRWSRGLLSFWQWVTGDSEEAAQVPAGP
jgi:hypothetical protein